MPIKRKKRKHHRYSYKKKRYSFNLQRSKKKIFSFFLLIVFSSIFLYLFFFSPYFQIETISIYNAKTVDQNKVINLVKKETKHRFLFLESESILILNKKEIKNDILNDFPKIENVKIKRDFPHEVIIYITERLPVAIFCNQNNHCYLLDKNGVIFDFAKNNNFFIIKDNSGKKKLNLGNQVMSQETVSKILKIKDSVKTISFKSLSIEEDHKFSFHSLEGPEIYFDLNEDINQQIFDLNSFFKKYFPDGELEKVDYIDVRFGNRVFWKEKSVDNKS